MVKYKRNDKFRLKVTDRCSFSCPFCHAEGGKHVKDIVISSDLYKAVELLRPLYSRVHITGGEPFLYDKLDNIMDILENYGYKMTVTTNGYFSLHEKQKTIERMEYINFSVHSFQKQYVANLTGRNDAAKYFIPVILQNIKILNQILPVKINTVVSDNQEGQRLEEIFEFCEHLNIELKLVPEWSVRDKASLIIKDILAKNGFNLYEKIYLLPGSNVRERYKNSREQIIEVKNIEFYFPDFLCKNCTKKEYCQEGFSFLRLGGEPLYFQPCIYNKKVGLEEFRETMLPNIYSMFEKVGIL